MKTVAVGLKHSCGIGRSGRLYCWGRNASGSLGFGDVGGLRGDVTSTPALVALINNAIEVAVASADFVDTAHTCAKTYVAGGRVRLYCWGDNRFGQLGIGRISPLQDSWITTPTEVY